MDHSEILRRVRASFQTEAADLLSELDDSLLVLEAAPENSDLVNRVFRALHTIKGSGATAGFLRLSGFAHKVEEVFNLAREGMLEITPELMDQALRACDLLREFLADADSTPDLHANLEAEIAAALSAYLPSSGSPDRAVNQGQRLQSITGPRTFSVVFRPDQSIFLSGNDPVSLVSEVAEMGQAQVTAHLENMPPLGELNPESCYAWWEITISTERSEQNIREVFLFVEDECALSIKELNRDASLNPTDLLPNDSLELFVCEGAEHLQTINEKLLRLEREPECRDHVAGVFRALHSIKGNASLLLSNSVIDVPQDHPLRVFHQVAHFAESLVEERSNDTPLTDWTSHVQALLEAADSLTLLLAAIDQRLSCPTLSAALLEQLNAAAGGCLNPSHKESQFAAFHNTAVQCMENMSGCLEDLGAESTPGSKRMTSYMRSLRTLISAARYLDYPGLRQELSNQSSIVDRLADSADPVSNDVRGALENSLDRVKKLVDEIDCATESSSPVSAAAAKGPGSSTEVKVRASDTSAQSIRVDQEKLDRLMRVVSELLVARGVLPVLSHKLDVEYRLTGVAKELKDAGSDISRIAEELQATVMSIRMIPISTVFHRFSRLVRDLARSMGKEIDLSFQGEDTELDKTVIQVIGDPLVHLVRNAADHGIERPDHRVAEGKSRTGHIGLRAYHDSNHVVIEVVDDGKGLDAELLKQKAIEKGLITADAALVMSEQDAYQLIFAPGFSTAEKVTDVSGRGVGMDVVINDIRKLKGTVVIESRTGEGSKFLIKLPTNVMISKGILVESGDLEFIVPIDHIKDMVQVPADSVHSHHEQKLLHANGRVYPLVSLRQYFETGDRSQADEETCVALIDAGKSSYGMIVDRFVNEVEVVVKRLHGGLEGREYLLGATIMGDGRVVLVINPAFDFITASAAA